MKPAPFQYHDPRTVSEAADLLGQFGDDAKVLAGGQSLVPILALRLARFDHLVDVNRVDGLAGVTRSNGSVRIGAITRQAAVERDATVAASVPLLSKATPFIGHFQIRNRGTLGGSIAHADPASEYPAVALALDAEIELASRRGTRTVKAADFFEGTWTTSMAGDELLTAVSFPVWQGRSGFAVNEVARRHGDFALVGAVVGVTVDGSKVTRAAISLFGVGSTPHRSSAAEAALVGAAANSADLTEIGRVAAADITPSDDVHASGTYRKTVAAVVVARALTEALKEASNG